MTIGINSTNRVRHAKVRETTFGVTPPNPVFKQLRVTSSSINTNPQTVISDELREDRQVSDVILIGQRPSGDINAELSFGSSDDDFEEALQSSWQLNPAIANTASNTPISALSSTTLTVASGGAAFLPGMVCLLSGFPTSANNGIGVVASSTATSIVFPAASWTAETLAIPVGAAINNVGFQGAAGDIAAFTNGLTSTTLDFTTLGFVVGEWLKIGGAATSTQFITAANNDWVRISSISAHAILFDRLPVGWAPDTGTGKTIRFWFSDFLRNGTTQISNTIERQYLDQSPVGYEYLTGMCIDKFSINVQAQQIIKLSKSYYGHLGSFQNTRLSGASDVAAPNYPVMNATTNVGRISINGAALPGQNFVMSVSIDVMNNLRPLYGSSSGGAVGIGNGEADVKLKLETYFSDATVYNYVLNNTAVSLDFRVQDASSPKETLLFDVPRIKFLGGAPSVGGKNQNVMLATDAQAIRDPSLNYTIGIYRFWYVE